MLDERNDLLLAHVEVGVEEVGEYSTVRVLVQHGLLYAKTTVFDFVMTFD